MQFITNGPDVPDALLEAHEDGTVVFFCGAGISYPADLPTFGNLVERIRIQLGTEYSPIEVELRKHWQYDLMLNSMEHRVAGQRAKLRPALAASLQPNLTLPGATETHRALLGLSEDKSGNVRLVTTNFDRIFDHVIVRDGLGVPHFAAPMLPVPKRSKWNGLVYLHGLLPEPLDQTGLDRLIVTSGDFGLAYLVERWAARFVSELFRNFVVCFVGYSLNDPVLRYMMDALAADRLLGETTINAYAFGGFKTGCRDAVQAEWQAKGVVPILYEEHPDPIGHDALHKTLIEWADMYRDGALGKSLIVSRFAAASVLGSTKQDDFAGRMVWALSDKSGTPAQRFAEMTPPPSLAWLEPLSKKRFGHHDLPRFGVAKDVVEWKGLEFSLLARPSPYLLSPSMGLVDNGTFNGRFDKVMVQLGNWLLRHLNDPKLVLWIAKRGGRLHDIWRDSVANHLRRIDSLSHTAPKELEQMLAESPAAVPSPALRPVWDLLLMDRVRSAGNEYDLYGWISSFRASGLTWVLKSELSKHLTACVTLAERYSFEREPPTAPQVPSQVLRWEIVLRADAAHFALRELKDDASWHRALPELLEQFVRLLRDAMELQALLGSATPESDRSYNALPSVEDHPQNDRIDEWATLIELTRDAWLQVLEVDPERAVREASAWWTKPFPVFKRLALFAASRTPLIPGELVSTWLASDRGRWLWSADTQRESMRYLSERSGLLQHDDARRVEAAILAGPTSVLTYEGVSDETLRAHEDRSIWLLLAKARAGGMVLSEEGIHRYLFLSILQRRTALSDDQREEFVVWMSSGFEALDDGAVKSLAPERRRDLVSWLEQSRPPEFWSDDGWRARCSSAFPATACALIALASRNKWPEDRWRAALQVWSEERLQRLSWKHMARFVVRMPVDTLLACRTSVSFWIRSVAGRLPGSETEFFQLIERVLDAEPDTPVEPDSDLFGTALNHPAGHVADALTSWWFAKQPQDNQPLPDSMAKIASKILDDANPAHRLGRVMLAANAVSFFRADSAWTAQHLLPLFDWQINADEALLAWTGYLSSPRFHRGFLEQLKEPFLDTASRYLNLGGVANQYADLLTHVALEAPDLFGTNKLRAATAELPQPALEHIAQFLVRVMRSAAEPSQYWTHRVAPYVQNTWPKDASLISQAISKNFARAAIFAKDAFPHAFAQVRPWIKPLPFPGPVAHDLKLSGLCASHPREALDLLNSVVPADFSYPISEVRACLDAIGTTQADLKGTAPYRRLNELAIRGG